MAKMLDAIHDDMRQQGLLMPLNQDRVYEELGITSEAVGTYLTHGSFIDDAQYPIAQTAARARQNTSAPTS